MDRVLAIACRVNHHTENRFNRHHFQINNRQLNFSIQLLRNRQYHHLISVYLIQEAIAQPEIETTVFKASESSNFDPISFFNNNVIEPTPQDTSNVNDFPVPNFFNEPPPLSEIDENLQEKNFNFIRTNLLNKRIERIANAETASPETLSLASVCAEPASSAQSETSYIEPPAMADKCSDCGNKLPFQYVLHKGTPANDFVLQHLKKNEASLCGLCMTKWTEQFYRTDKDQAGPSNLTQQVKNSIQFIMYARNQQCS